MKSVVNFEVKKDDRTYIFSIPMGAPYGESYDVCFEMLQKIKEMASQAADAQKRQPAEGE